MKKLQLLLFLASMLILSGCYNSDSPLPEKDSNAIVQEENPHAISQEEAINIANIVLNRNSSRAANQYSIEYVLSETKSRSNNTSSDTLAYVLNYPNNEGFVIVSSDDRVYPVLAFSDTGHFTFDNEIARDNFISNIESYIKSSPESSNFEVNSDDFDGCYEVHPMINISIGQRNPWDKYVIKENPGCPVGCVAVATALVISHSCMQISYHGVKYQTGSIITAIKKGKSEDSNGNKTQSIKRISGGHPSDWPIYSYEQAVDSMAKILYWIGKDIDITYTPSASSAYSADAFQLCKSLGLSIPSGYAQYNLMRIINYLKDNHIIYLRGSDIDGKGGHAWVSDGCCYCIDLEDSTRIYNTYIHCDWGWDGYCNGFYSGDVFEASSYKFKVLNFFAIKRDATLSNFLYSSPDE